MVDISNLLKNKPTTQELKELVKDPDLYRGYSFESTWDHSSSVDKLFGLKCSNIEHKLLKQYRAYYREDDTSNRKQKYVGTQTWIGLHPQALQTPYSEIIHFLSLIKKYAPNKIVDFGAGYGRVALVMQAILPGVDFLGYEIVEKRANEAIRIFEKLELENAEMRIEDLLSDDFEFPKADLYFMYDFSDPQDLRAMLRKLSDKIRNDRFFLVARGEGIRSLIQLRFPEFWACHGAIHEGEWSLYSSFVDLV